MMSILVIDDDKLVAKTIDRALSIHGYKVETATSGDDAINKTKIHNYDIVLSDIRMPKMDGVETLNNIGGNSKKLLMTGFSDIYDESCGVKCLMKPFGINDLLEHLK